MTNPVFADFALQYATPPDQVRHQLEHAGLTLVQQIPALELQVAEDIYANEDRTVVIRYIRDHQMSIDFLAFETADGPLQAEFFEKLSASLKLFDSVDLAGFGRDEDRVHRSFGLRALAATARGFWFGTYRVIETALSDERENIRQIALLVIARLGWWEFVALLEHYIPTEPSAQVRETAQELLGLLRIRAADEKHRS